MLICASLPLLRVPRSISVNGSRTSQSGGGRTGSPGFDGSVGDRSRGPSAGAVRATGGANRGDGSHRGAPLRSVGGADATLRLLGIRRAYVHVVRSNAAAGLVFAVASAAAFGTSGTFATSLLAIGWTPGAAVIVRIAIAAAALTVFVVPQVLRHR